ncbi:hypothetical protein HJA86_04905 [Rhizobium bangladeshense]|nr:hypothetical protein [Rhizobium bangladeshense]
MTGLLVIVTAIISAATISAGSAGYVGVLLPLSVSSINAGFVLTMGAISCLAAASSITFAGAMTVIDVGGLLLIVGAGFSEGVGLIERLPEAWPGGNPTAWVGVFGAAMIAVFSFIGFEHLVNIAEEMKTPWFYRACRS